MCGKKVYSKEDAQYVVNYAKTGSGGRHYKLKKRPERIYFCKDCNGWHVTSKKLRDISYTNGYGY